MQLHGWVTPVQLCVWGRTLRTLRRLFDVPGRLWGVPDDDEHDLNYDNHGGGHLWEQCDRAGRAVRRNERDVRGDMRFSYVRVRCSWGA